MTTITTSTESPGRRRARPRFVTPTTLVVSVAIALAVVVGAWAVGSGDDADDGRAVRRAATIGFAPLDERVSVLDGRVRAADADYLDRTALAGLLLESTRTTGDPRARERAAVLLEEALANNPAHAPAASLLAAVALGDHDFAGALEQAEAVLLTSPDDVGARSVVVDANIELGRTGAAQEALFELAAVAGGEPGVLLRRAHLARMVGDVGGGVDDSAAAVDAAVEAGWGGPDLALVQARHVVHLVQAGRADEAVPIAEAAVENAPSSPGVLAALAEVRLRSGDHDAAIELLERAIAISPTPDLLLAAADVHRSRGDEAAAADHDATLLAVADLADASGDVAHRRTIARFLADREVEPERAVALAAAEVEARPDAISHAVHARALLAADRTDEALVASERSLAQGLADPAHLAAAGHVHAAAGRTDRAVELLERALALDGRFHPLGAPAARALLDDLVAAR